MIAALRLYAAQNAAAIRAAASDRANFSLQVGGMLVNDLFLLVLWGMFFAGFRRVGGWEAADMALLLGQIMTVVGICGVFFGGYRDMAAAILRGELDALLTQPKAPLLRLLARESSISAWGDLAVGLVMLIVVAGLDPRAAPLAVFAVAAGVVVYLSAGVAFASLAFWIAGARTFARDLTDFTLLFCTYPGSIYGGLMKVAAFTILPAGFVTLAPVELIRAPSLAGAATVAGAALGYVGLAVGLFHLGLRRYRREAGAA